MHLDKKYQSTINGRSDSNTTKRITQNSAKRTKIIKSYMTIMEDRKGFKTLCSWRKVITKLKNKFRSSHKSLLRIALNKLLNNKMILKLKRKMTSQNGLRIHLLKYNLI